MDEGSTQPPGHDTQQKVKPRNLSPSPKFHGLQITNPAERSADSEPDHDQSPSPTATTTITSPQGLETEAFRESSAQSASDRAIASPTNGSSSPPTPASEQFVPVVPAEDSIVKSTLDETVAGKTSVLSPESNLLVSDQKAKAPTSVTESASAAPAKGNSVAEQLKDENGFIFYKCRFCGLTYNYLTTLRAHERVHNIDEPYKCNRCSESFHYMCELEYHAKQHTDLKGYKCECGRTFHTYTDLLYHKHPSDEDEETIVTVAPIVTSKSAPRIPESEFPVPEFIEKGFEPKHPLKVYTDVRLNPYICQYCSKSYPNSRMLAYHMYGHRGERIFNPRASRYLMARTENSYISPGV